MLNPGSGGDKTVSLTVMKNRTSHVLRPCEDRSEADSEGDKIGNESLISANILWE